MLLRDDIAHHRKFLVAGEMLGGSGGAARALAVWIAAIGYARRFHTDGFVDEDYVRDKCVTFGGRKVANVLCSRRVRLFHRVKNGYIVHDFGQYNGTSDKLQRQRELAAARKRKQRAKVGDVTRDVTRDSHDVTQRDKGVTRARARKEREKEDTYFGTGYVRSAHRSTTHGGGTRESTRVSLCHAAATRAWGLSDRRRQRAGVHSSEAGATPRQQWDGAGRGRGPSLRVLRARVRALPRPAHRRQ